MKIENWEENLHNKVDRSDNMIYNVSDKEKKTLSLKRRKQKNAMRHSFVGNNDPLPLEQASKDDKNEELIERIVKDGSKEINKNKSQIENLLNSGMKQKI